MRKKWLLLLPIAFLGFSGAKSVAGWVAGRVVERSIAAEREGVISRLKKGSSDREALLTIKEENRYTPFQYGLIGPSGRPLYDPAPHGSIHLQTAPFTLNENNYVLQQIIPDSWKEQEILRYKDLVALIGLFFLMPSVAASGIAIRLWISNRTLRIRREEASYERGLIADQIGVGVCIFDRNLHVKDVNQTCAEQLGCVKPEIIGDFFKRSKGKTALKETLKSLCIRCQDRSNPVEDRCDFLDAIAIPSYGGRIVTIIQDRSSHYRILKMGKDFIGNASHELRTPITIIKGFIETLVEMPEVTEAMLEDVLHKVLRNCERMEQLIQKLLLLADLDSWPSGRMRTCDLVNIIDESVHTIKAVHPEARIEVECQKEEMLIRGDSELLELAISNLLQNAVKYSSGTPEIKVKVEEIVNETQISIADQGCGIPEKDLPHIFERFYTVDKARSRKLGGAGLGLSIVKTIVDKHEGKIKAVSKEGRGSSFIASLPRS